MPQTTRAHSGHTILESILYIAILIVISVFVTSYLAGMASLWGSSRNTRNVTDAGKLIMERITQEIRLAQSIDQAQSVFGSHPGSVTLNTFESPTSSASTTVSFSLSGTTLQMQQAANPAQALHSPKIRTTRLFITRIATSNSEALRIDLSVETGAGSTLQQKNYFTTVVLRGSY